VQRDGYAPYKKLPAERITVAFCWSHLRREFFKIAERGDAPIATEAVARIAQIYAVEKDVRGTSADQRRAARRARSRPLIDALKIFFEHQLTRLAGGSDMARIIRYGLRHWDGLTRFLHDGRIELDTNIVERSMRPQAMHESLCGSSSSICKHWKRARVGNATRAAFSGHRHFDRLRRKVVGTDLIRCTGNNLHSRKDAGFDKAPYRMVCDA